MLVELVEEEKIQDKDRKKLEELVQEVEGLKEEKERYKERCNTEAITLNILERLIRHNSHTLCYCNGLLNGRSYPL